MPAGCHGAAHGKNHHTDNADRIYNGHRSHDLTLKNQKYETRNTKYETNSNYQNSMNKIVKSQNTSTNCLNYK
jgi:hypothetical protein